MQPNESNCDSLQAQTRLRTRIYTYTCDSPSPSKTRRSSPSLNPSQSTPTPPALIDFGSECSSRKRKHGVETTDADDELPVLGANPRKRTRKGVRTIEQASQDASSTQRKKTKKKQRGYAPPEVYEHLHMLPDYLEQYLDVMFCGIKLFVCGDRPSLRTFDQSFLGMPAFIGYDVCYKSIPTVLTTNLVDRPSAEQSELSSDEMRAAVPDLVSKILKFRPRVVCFLAKSIWEIFIREVFRIFQDITSPPLPSTPTKSSPGPSRNGTPKLVASRFFPREETPVDDPAEGSPGIPGATKRKKGRRVAMPKYSFDWGLQPFKVVHRQLYDTPLLVKETLFFVVPSPSARVVRYQWWHKVEKFQLLKSCIHDVKASRIDTSNMHIIPSDRISSKSIYCYCAAILSLSSLAHSHLCVVVLSAVYSGSCSTHAHAPPVQGIIWGSDARLARLSRFRFLSSVRSPDTP
ncbi:hypothetical protein NM688_g4331 [Phlebia brevispora]|uniref:Uncharacterized protein n=1 Tax=Phlebia brevispora TaxID=194682 RepID=A0ACC1T391_9APHY|nr:hypothetical protein NM688_g4331 [Phlebia brevispora]